MKSSKGIFRLVTAFAAKLTTSVTTCLGTILVLSPADLTKLNIRAKALPLTRPTNYRREIELSPRVPSVISARRRRNEKEAKKAARAAAKKEARAASRQALEDALTGYIDPAEAAERLNVEKRLAGN